MAEVILMPKMSDTMEEGVIASWLVKVGDEISAGDVLAEVETDKATMELESYVDGTLLYIGVEEKDSVPVNDVIAIVGEEGEDYKPLLEEHKGGGDESKESDGGEKKKEEKKETSDKDKQKDSSEKEDKEDSSIDVSDIPAEVVTMPKMSDTMEEGVISSWLVKEGDEVSSGDVLAEVETDKATMELENYEDGTVLYLAVEAGGSVPVDGIIAIIGEKDADYKKLLKAHKQEASDSEGKEKKEEKEEKPKKAEEAAAAPSKSDDSAKQASAPAKGDSEADNTTPEGRIKASPLARKLAEEKGFDLSQISGSGEQGRIVKRDVEEHEPKKAEQPAPASSSQKEQKEGKSESHIAAVPSPTALGEESYEEQNVSQMRKIIAKRLGESKFTAPHFYLTMEINMDKAIESRKALNEISPVKISFNDLVIKAASVALKQHPGVNSSWLGDKIRYNHHVHIGMAVAVDEGLLVPVIRFANQKTLSQISAEAKDFGKRAKERKLQPADWEGNTFTISNLGMLGIEEFTAIINPPDSCILAVGGIKETPIVKDGELAVGNVMKVTMSCDHRVVDGAMGAAFLQTLKKLLEDPIRMLV